MKKLLSIIIVVVVVGAGAFYGGMKYGQSKSSLRQQRFQQLGISGTGPRSGNQAGGGFATGEILSKDDKSITIKLRDGGSKIIFYSDTTEIDKFATGTANDLEVGKTVTINGETNQDGSITAQSIQIRPEIPSQP